MKDGQISVAAWVESDITPFDDRDKFREHIQPMVTALVEKCHELDITIIVEAFVGIQPDGTPAVMCSRTYKRELGTLPAEAIARVVAQDVSYESLSTLKKLVVVDAERILRLRDTNAIPDITH